MAPHRCFVVPPYLLRDISKSAKAEDHIKKSAEKALGFQSGYAGKRVARISQQAKVRASGSRHSAATGFIPNALLRTISELETVDSNAREQARRDLAQNTQKQLAQTAAEGSKATALKKNRTVYDAKNTWDESALPGDKKRAEGGKASSDASVNEAYDNSGLVLDFYAKKFGWFSIDNENAPVVSSVHFGENYENAFWDSEKFQMVYGDGHDFLTNFTSTIDVIGHELTHAVTEHTSPLNYSGQSGALNEHISDVFGIMVKQYVEKETADVADWLIGENCIAPGVKGVALRSMKAPGTAYDDPRFGKDPQPAHMSGYKETTQDNGGVHLYSGIPNKAFYLVSVAFGGFSYEKAGKIWWDTMNSGQLSPNANFKTFARLTVQIAEDKASVYGADAAGIVQTAWEQVGVLTKAKAK